MLKLFHYLSTYLGDYFISDFLILYDRIYLQKISLHKQKENVSKINFRVCRSCVLYYAFIRVRD